MDSSWNEEKFFSGTLKLFSAFTFSSCWNWGTSRRNGAQNGGAARLPTACVVSPGMAWFRFENTIRFESESSGTLGTLPKKISAWHRIESGLAQVEFLFRWLFRANKSGLGTDCSEENLTTRITKYDEWVADRVQGLTEIFEKFVLPGKREGPIHLLTENMT